MGRKRRVREIHSRLRKRSENCTSVHELVRCPHVLDVVTFELIVRKMNEYNRNVAFEF